MDKGVPGQVLALLTPTKWKMRPKPMRRYLRQKGVNIDAHLKKALIHAKKTRSRRASRAVLGDAPRGTYGALCRALEKLERDYLVAQGGFTEHTPHLLGPPLVVPETDRATFAISTENLLLNAYRQSQFGLPSMLSVDTTHRLVVEGHCCMAVGTMSPTQHFHTIGYGICSHEDTAAHEHVIGQIKDAVNAVVHARALARRRV